MTLLEGVAFLKKAYSEVGFKAVYAQARPSIIQQPLLPADQDVELSVPPAPCLPTHCHPSHHANNGLTL